MLYTKEIHFIYKHFYNKFCLIIYINIVQFYEEYNQIALMQLFIYVCIWRWGVCVWWGRVKREKGRGSETVIIHVHCQVNKHDASLFSLQIFLRFSNPIKTPITMKQQQHSSQKKIFVVGRLFYTYPSFHFLHSLFVFLSISRE